VSHTIVEVDVSSAVPLDGPHRVVTWVFAPFEPAARVPLLVCLPGGSYTKAYWHLEVPGHPGYSFAEHMARRGMLVVAVDHLGTGESSVARAIDLTPGVVAGANAVVCAELVDRARHVRSSSAWASETRRAITTTKGARTRRRLM